MIKVISPVDGSVFVERPLAKGADIGSALDRARIAQRSWRTVPVTERARILNRFCDLFEAKRDEIARIAERILAMIGEKPLYYAQVIDASPINVRPR